MDNVNQYVLFPADQTCITEQQKKSYQKDGLLVLYYA